MIHPMIIINDNTNADVNYFPWQDKQAAVSNATNALPSLIESSMDKSTNTKNNNNNDIILWLQHEHKQLQAMFHQKHFSLSPS